MKAIGQGSGGGAGTNTSGFSALLAGCRDITGDFSNLGNYAFVWSSTQVDVSNPRNLILDYDIGLTNFWKSYEFSVRCLKN